MCKFFGLTHKLVSAQTFYSEVVLGINCYRAFVELTVEFPFNKIVTAFIQNLAEAQVEYFGRPLSNGTVIGVLFDVKNVGKSRKVEDFHICLIYVAKNHAAFGRHSLVK